MPVASDDGPAIDVAAGLVRDVAYVPVRTGDLASAKLFNRGTDVFADDMNAADARKGTGLPPTA